ncbi:chitin synthase-domain-containing protein [Globomyces pollinis-pini]|nr:chitin synthase-domain-containing protein [Globomyces pollinis-pini]
MDKKETDYQSTHHLSMQRVKPEAGNFVMSVPISKYILQDAEFKDGEEFTHVTYTAVTGEPEEFPSRYQLRARRYGREVKVALVVTMYNEDDDLFTKSMMAVQRNIAFLCSKQCPFSWGKDGWKNFVVVIVSDGRTKIDERVLVVLSAMGCYVPGLPRTSVDSKPVSAHIFEFTTQVGISRSMEMKHRRDGIVPTQIVFVLKEKNAKKINSHKWFFNAVCESIQPDVCMLLDVGTKPEETSLFHLYRAFERDPRVGGACGEIQAELGPYWKNLINPLVATQNFEYKMSNILDKPLESVFGYISVLPGAFSAYRYSALLGRPLEQYFMGENPAADIFTSNLYLAEDRILCFELVTKKEEPWILKYAKSARAETDVPDTLAELVSQRRRWLNGSFFASVHSLMHFNQIFSSPHSGRQKALFVVEFLYNAFNLYFGWFSLANFYLAFFFLFDVTKLNTVTESSPDDPFKPHGVLVFNVLRGAYTFSIITMFITALGNRPQGSKWLYRLISFIFAVIMGLMLFMGAWSIKIQFNLYWASPDRFKASSLINYLLNNPAFRDLFVSVASTYGLYLIASLMHLDPWHCFTSMIQYLLILPTFTNMFTIYSFCNLHDVSWGTKGATTMEDSKPVVKKVTDDGVEVYELEVPTEEDDVNDAWNQTMKQIEYNKTHRTEGDNKRDEKTKKEDATKEFRTKVVLSWIASNLILIVIFTNPYSLNYLFKNTDISVVNPYLTFLFWSVAGLALIRFIGCSVYMTQWWMEKVQDAGRAGGHSHA